MAAVPNDAVGSPAAAGGELAGNDGPSAEARMRAIHAAHAGPLLRFLTRLTLGDRDLAEDLLQETLLRAWRNLDLLSVNIEKIGPWLYTVARNVAIDAARARRARPPEVAIPDISRLASDGDAMDRLAIVQTIRQGLVRLSPDHRAVLIELYFRGSSTAEAAARLGIPEGTVKSRAYHAVRSLHAAVGSMEPS